MPVSQGAGGDGEKRGIPEKNSIRRQLKGASKIPDQHSTVPPTLRLPETTNMSSPVTNSAAQKFSQKVFNKETLKYVFTTHFWGPVSNFGIPIAAILDLKNKPEETISGPMTAALVVYSAVFMRYSLAVTPQNYLLFGCHVVNEIAQLGQGARFIHYNYLSSRPAAVEEKK